ncbi:hypothetical protein SERLA73DRAFT_187820 [Serpula lacrymans var. lacrymans S7.3]|uniref:Uncharacterized protein n=2 Tax=Serpula lacrymans var. lacrymans TaxID=341189 RepID=F8QAH4_SERL3|nr:hypothetical protein SERLA73DRAFT_187820 [Serpula lacrymans var. lacrymans S7.3]
MVDKHGKDFPEVAGYKAEWDSYNKRWVKYLWDSRDVASEMSATLSRYDEVFLQLISEIKTDEDRKECIKELASFGSEKHQTSAQMAGNFRNLEADVRGFGERFATYLEQKKVELEQLATTLKTDIDALQEQIKNWNEKIAAGLMAMGAGLALSFWTLIITGSAIAYFIAQRIKAEKALNAKKTELAEVNRKQRALAELKTRFDGLKPDIALICEKLIIFGNIWQSVSTQCAEFGSHLEKGMDALNDEEFRLQVTLARKTCTPLRNGLRKYATTLEHSPLPKS